MKKKKSKMMLIGIKNFNHRKLSNKIILMIQPKRKMRKVTLSDN